LLLSELPLGWVKEIDMKGNVYFYNELMKIATKKHPCIRQYRKIFSHVVKRYNMQKNNYLPKHQLEGKQFIILFLK
jgi:hypothetical protein